MKVGLSVLILASVLLLLEQRARRENERMDAESLIAKKPNKQMTLTKEHTVCCW